MRFTFALVGVIAVSHRGAYDMNDVDEEDIEKLRNNKPADDTAAEAIDNAGIKEIDNDEKELEDLKARTKTWAEQKKNEYALAKKKVEKIRDNEKSDGVLAAILKENKKEEKERQEKATSDNPDGSPTPDDAAPAEPAPSSFLETHEKTKTKTKAKYDLNVWDFDNVKHTEADIHEAEKGLNTEMAKDHEREKKMYNNFEKMAQELKDDPQPLPSDDESLLQIKSKHVTDEDVQDERDHVLAEEAKADSVLSSLRKELQQESLLQVGDTPLLAINAAKAEDPNQTLERLAKMLHSQAQEIKESDDGPRQEMKALRQADQEVEAAVNRERDQIDSFGRGKVVPRPILTGGHF